MKRASIVIEKNKPQLIGGGLVFVLLGLFGCYMYLITASVVNVVVAKESQQIVSSLQSDITTLESRYMALQYTIDEQEAQAQGYVASNNKVFISGNDDTLVVSRTQ